MRKRYATNYGPVKKIHGPRGGAVIDEASWALSCQMDRGPRRLAQPALKKLAESGLPTDLNVELSIETFCSLHSDLQQGLRALWLRANAAGQRTAAIHTELDILNHRRQLTGVDQNTITFALEGNVIHSHERVPVWTFLARLQEAGHPTDLDADLDSPVARVALEEVLDLAARGDFRMAEPDQLVRVRRALRRFYEGAVKAGYRTRPVPAVLVTNFTYAEGKVDVLFARLPEADRAQLLRVEAHLWELARVQQAGRARGTKPTKARQKKKTLSQSHTIGLRNTIRSLLHHADTWGWSIEEGWDGLLTPERVARFAYQGHLPSGGRVSASTISSRHINVVRLLERAGEAGTPLVAAERVQAIKAELEAMRREGEWNVTDPENDTGKWFPTIAQLETGRQALEDGLGRARLRYEEDQNFNAYWAELRSYAIAVCAFICMWRLDTATTIDLSRAARDPETRRVRWRDGSIRIRHGARAKQSGNRSYYVPELLIPPAAVDVIEDLLTLEGRSLEEPLRPGEHPVSLQIGEKWGRDVLLDEGRTVIPLFRRHPHRPEGAGIAGIQRAMQRMLRRMGWDAINPHTLRTAGAIWWRYTRGRQLAAIMALGLWTDERTLTQCYAHLSQEDLYADIALGAPSRHLVTSAGNRSQLHAVLEEAQQQALALRLAASPSRFELERVAGSFRGAATALELASGRQPKRAQASRLRQDADYIRIDEALKPLYPGGLGELLGYDVLADAAARKRSVPEERRPDRGMRRRLREVLSEPPPRRTQRQQRTA